MSSGKWRPFYHSLNVLIEGGVYGRPCKIVRDWVGDWCVGVGVGVGVGVNVGGGVIVWYATKKYLNQHSYLKRVLTHWDKMATILQTTFSKVSSSMETFGISNKIAPDILQLTLCHHWFR